MKANSLKFHENTLSHYRYNIQTNSNFLTKDHKIRKIVTSFIILPQGSKSSQIIKGMKNYGEKSPKHKS